MDKNRKALFTSDRENWETPQWLFEEYDAQFNFTLDACASRNNKNVA